MQKATVYWLTGLPGSGKTSIATGVSNKLRNEQNWVVHLDGDFIRKGINKDLGYSEEDRKENIRRVAELCKILNQQKISVICSFISPTLAIRNMAQNIIGPKNFHEIFINAPLEVCIQRDPKGLYKKALKNEITNFTGISAPFEAPIKPLTTIQTDKESLEESVERIYNFIIKH